MLITESLEGRLTMLNSKCQLQHLIPFDYSYSLSYLFTEDVHLQLMLCKPSECLMLLAPICFTHIAAQSFFWILDKDGIDRIMKAKALGLSLLKAPLQFLLVFEKYPRFDFYPVSFFLFFDLPHFNITMCAWVCSVCI